jgi:O-acetyl-ADP-ribose deacetylase (regulator of RNase III)
MIRFTRGNLLKAPSEALVNTVNEVGVMGKGIALMFRDAFPSNASEYMKAAKEKKVKVGQMFVTENPEFSGPRWIINFPTKKHWRHPSKIGWIREGLDDLVRVIKEMGIRSIAIPPLGAGAGGLEWSDVRSAIESAMAVVPDVEVLVYEPTAAYQSSPKESGVENLTPARALVAESIRRYEVLGLECTILEVQKLAWFLTRAIAKLHLPDVLKLRFKANLFGPYDDNLRHLLNSLDGSFLHAEKRLADAGPLDLIRFDYAKQSTVVAYLHGEWGRDFLPAMEYTAALIDGFESPLGMELLATVDWLLSRQGIEPSVASLRSALKSWPGGPKAGRRKFALFDERLLGLALIRLQSPPPLIGRGLFTQLAG